jgi:hypothetical protein
MRCASLSVGVADYANAAYRSSATRLQFAAQDAQAFHAYASQIDPLGPHVLLPDAAATADGLATAFVRIEAAGELDLLLIYLSGHGDRRGWFCLCDASPDAPSLTASILDGHLAKIETRNVLVFVDCCYAEAMTAEIFAAGTLLGRSAQVVVASARSDQRSWEDDALKRSIFSDVLLRALSSDGNDAAADLERDILPALRQQVPLLTAERKQGQIQEPVSAGALAGSIALPRFSSKSLGRPLSVSEVVRGRVRAAIVGVAVIAVTSILALDALTFHLQVDGSGQVLVLSSLQPLHDLLPVHFQPDVDTGVALGDLKSDDDFLARLSSGAIWGFSPHHDADGLKTWLSMLEPALQPAIATNYKALARGRALPLDPDDDGAPVASTTFLARLLDRPAADVGSSLYPVDAASPPPCSADPATTMDFVSLGPTPAVFALDAAWNAVVLPGPAEAAAANVVTLVTLAAYRAAADAKVGAADLPGLARGLSIVRLRSQVDDGLRQALVLGLASINTGWCRAYGAFAVALLGDPEASAAAERDLWQMFEASAQSEGQHTADPDASDMLAYVAGIRPLSQDGIAALGRHFLEDDNRLLAATPETALLDSVDRTSPLPANFSAHLVQRLVPQGAYDFVPYTAIRLLACNWAFADGPTHESVQQWLDAHLTDDSIFDDVQLAAGCVGRATARDDGLLSALLPHLSSASRFPTPATTYRGVTLITVTGDEAAVAIARMCQGVSLDGSVLERLARIAEARPDLPGRPDLITCLADRWYRDGADVAAQSFDRLAAADGSAVRRRLEVEILSSALGRLPAEGKRAAVAALLAAWHAEARPELRQALASAIVAADLGTGAPFF